MPLFFLKHLYITFAIPFDVLYCGFSALLIKLSYAEPEQSSPSDVKVK